MSENVEAPKRSVLKLKRKQKPVEPETKLGPVVTTKPKAKKLVKDKEPVAKPFEKVKVEEAKTTVREQSKSEEKPKLETKEKPKKEKYRPLKHPKPPSNVLMRYLSPEDRKKALNYGRKCVKKAQAKWPSLFDLDNPKPFKIGLFNDLNTEKQLKDYELKNAFWYFCRSRQYLLALTPGAARYDKDGNQTSTVTMKEASPLARKELARKEAEASKDKDDLEVNT